MELTLTLNVLISIKGIVMAKVRFLLELVLGSVARAQIHISRSVCMRIGVGINISARVQARVRFRLRLRELKHLELGLC